MTHFATIFTICLQVTKIIILQCTTYKPVLSILSFLMASYVTHADKTGNIEQKAKCFKGRDVFTKQLAPVYCTEYLEYACTHTYLTFDKQNIYTKRGRSRCYCAVQSFLDYFLLT